MFNKFKREAKMRYYKNKIELNKNNIKNTWKTIKEVIGKNNDKSSVPKQMTIDGKIVTHAKEIANGFNTFFSNIGKTTGENVPHTNTNYLEYLKQSKVNSMFVEPVTQLEILKIVNKIKPKTSYGHDEISTKLIKDVIFNIIVPLTHIINRSIHSGICPDDLKIAKIIPIYKASDASLQKNYSLTY